MKPSLLSMCCSALFLLALVASPAAAETWHFRMVPLGEADFAGVKFEESTGESWALWSGGANWVECGEEEDLPRSKYEVTAIHVGTAWFVVRHDIKTGLAWRLNAGKWEAIEND